MVRTAAAVLCAVVLLSACASRYTRRQAAADLPIYEHLISVYDPTANACIANYFFERMTPGQVRALIQGADFGDPPPIVYAASDACQPHVYGGG